MTTTSHIQLPFTTSHAFIVGINNYEHLTPLSTAVNDARVLAERLAEQHGFTVHAPLLNATHKELHKLLTEDIPKLVGKDDRVLFYFAGHGIALDGEEGPNGYLVAADTRPGQEATLIPMATLHDALTGLPCRHGLLILDCCFSGAFKWSSGYRDVIFDLPKVIYEERFWRYCKDPAWQVITSSAHDQKAVDILTNQSLGLREEGKSQHSPFAASLLKALAGDGDIIPAGSGDGIITATELYTYLRDTVENATTENAKRQSPSIFNLKRHDKGEFIFLHPNHRFNLPPTPDRNPFMGLSSYNEEDANLFYGRDRVVEALLGKVKTNSFTVVSGASGTGKSSVIKAGVLPQLRKAGRTILPIIRPGKEPMQTIATELPNIDQQLKNGAPVLVIDQYEELITQCLNPEERLAFEQQIAQWLQQYPELDIILSIRSDFEPQFESEALAPWWAKGRYVIPAFSLEEIREIITRPAAQAVLFYEPEDLVEQLSEEVSQAPGALPLLSFTLSELYHAYLKSGREDRALAQEDYQKLGGVIGALRTRADAEYEALNPDEQSSMRKLMLRMVSLEGGELAGKRVYSEELQFNDATETARLQTIARHLVDARLLLQGTDGQGRAYIEPAHDALVRAWGRLWEWVKTTGEENITLQYKLSQAVNDYKELAAKEPKKARNLLWTNNPRLDLLKAALGTKNHNLNAQEEIFVRDSIKRRTARQRTSWGIAIGVMAGLAALALVAIYQKGIAVDQANQAKSSKTTLKAQMYKALDRNLVLNLAMSAYKLDSSATNIESISNLLSDPEQLAYKRLPVLGSYFPSAPFSADGKYVLLIGKDGKLKLFTIEGEEQYSFESTQVVEDAKFSADGQHIITKDVAGGVHWWKTDDRKSVDHTEPVDWTESKQSLYAIDFSSDTSPVINGYEISLGNGANRSIHISTPEINRILSHPEGFLAIAISQNRRWALTMTGSAEYLLWYLLDNREAEFVHESEMFRPITFVSSSGQAEAFLTGSDQNTVKIWTDEATKPQEFQYSFKPISGTFSPDGKWIVVRGTDVSETDVRETDAINWQKLDKTGSITKTLAPKTNISKVSFSPDGKTIYASSLSFGILAWTLAGEQLASPSAEEDIRDFSIFSTAEGQFASTIKRNGPVEFWKIVGNNEWVKQPVSRMHPDHFYSLTSLPDGSLHLLGSSLEALVIDNQGDSLYTLKHNSNILGGGTTDDKIYSVDFSTNGRYLLTGSSASVKVWNTTGQLLQTFPSTGALITSAVFSKDSKSVLIGYDNGKAVLYNIFYEEWYDGSIWNRISKLSKEEQTKY